MEVNFTEKGRHKIININGDVNIFNASQLQKAFLSIAEDENESVVINLSGVNYMDSSGIGALVAGQKKIKANNSSFGLVNVNDNVLNILKLATLDRFFKIYTESELNPRP